MKIFAQICGWIGTFLVVLAYFCISTKKMDSTSRNYQLMNLIGALALGVHVLYQHAWPAVALEIIWGTIAIVSLLQNAR